MSVLPNRNKDRGSQYERDVEAIIKQHGFADALRTRAGRREDEGDIHVSFHNGRPAVIVQAKDVVTPVWREWLSGLREQTLNARAQFGFLVVKRRGRGGVKPIHLAVVELDDLLELLKKVEW